MDYRIFSFEGPIKDAIIKNVNFKQNVMGSENVVFLCTEKCKIPLVKSISNHKNIPPLLYQRHLAWCSKS